MGIILDFRVQNFTGTFLSMLQMEVNTKNNKTMVQHITICQHAKIHWFNVQIKFFAL